MNSNSLLLFILIGVTVLSTFNRNKRMEELIKVSENTHQAELTHRAVDIFTHKPEVTPERVKLILDSIGVRHSGIVTAQAVLETGHFNCIGCSYDYYNIFGFRYKGEYLKFGSITEACEYYKRWQNKRYDPKRDYYDFLRCIYEHSNGDCVSYASDPEYVIKVKEMVRTLGL